MARPRTPIGTFGAITRRRLAATGSLRAAAERELRRRLSERSLFRPGFTGISAQSSFAALVDYWLDDMDVEDRLSRTTRLLYERNMRTLVLPAFEELTLRGIGMAHCDHFLKQLAKQNYERARQVPVVLRLALGLVVRQKIIPRNPMDHVSRLCRPAHIPDAFTVDDIKAIRRPTHAWEHPEILAGPRPDGQLGQIVEVMLGTSHGSGRFSPSD